MQTIAQPRTARKAFYAHLDSTAGYLTKVGQAILFLDPETGAITTIGPEHVNFLVVLGQVDVAMEQYISDMTTGGYAKVACTRQMEVA